MEPAVFPLTIYQGANWPLSFQIKDDTDTPLDLTGYSAKAMWRRTWEGPVVLQRSTADGTITINGSWVHMVFLPADTASLKKFVDGELDLLYDIDITAPDGTVTRVLMGDATISEAITR